MATEFDDSILLEFRGIIAVITLNRPEKLNALTIEHYALLAKRMREAAANDNTIVTVLTGKGRYFSAGVIVHANKEQASTKEEEEARKLWLATFTATNIDTTRAFFSHPKILIAALNGPAVGFSAALIAHCDFIYATEEFFLLTPFVTLGLVGEGCASYTFAKRLGLSKANEALLSARRMPASELLACGFLNKIFPSTASFLPDILKLTEDTWGGNYLNRESVLSMKRLIRMGQETEMEATNVREHFAGLERFARGIPQREFSLIAKGAKKHKL